MQARPFAAAALALAAQSVHAADWPGTAPCNGTLQACINGTPDGGTIRIVTNTPIDESLNLYNRSLTLTAGPGYKPRLAPANWITASSSTIAGDQTVNLSGLTLLDGYVQITYGGAGTGRYDVRNMTLQGTGPSTFIGVTATNGSRVEAMVYDNAVTGVPSGVNRGLIEFSANGATLDARALYNRVTSADVTDDVDGAGIRIDASNGASGTTRLHANTIRGAFWDGSIRAIEGRAASSASDYAVRLYNNVAVCPAPPGLLTGKGGIQLWVDLGVLGAQVVNNTVSNCYTGITARPWRAASPAAAQIEGMVKNNLIVASQAIGFDAAHTTSLTNDYNLVNGAINGTTLGANSTLLAAQLVDPLAPRLKSTSPAINAADTSTLGFGLIFNGLPVVDADGLRRIKEAGGGDDADIGAYEYGDLSFLHRATAANTSSYISSFDHPASNGRSAANLIATPNFGGNAAGTGIGNDNAFGIYWSTPRWLVFNEDATTPMPLGVRYNVFAPAPGSGSIRHVSSAANIAGRFTEIDSGSTNAVPGYIVLATQNWSAGSGVYNAHPIGIAYNATSERWRIANLDAAGAAMPANAGFNLYAQPESPNAFRVTALTGGTQAITLDHPLLNGVPCAQVNTTRVWSGTTVTGNHDVYYGSDGTWRIFSYGAMPAGTTFHVVIDPRQVYECTDRIFANGFE